MTAVGPPDWPITALPVAKLAMERLSLFSRRAGECRRLRPLATSARSQRRFHLATSREMIVLPEPAPGTNERENEMSAKVDRTKSVWPELRYTAWKDTYATLHLWTQIVGKIRLAQTPWLNHSWHVVLYVSPRGLTTSSIPYGDRSFELEFDFVTHVLVAS